MTDAPNPGASPVEPAPVPPRRRWLAALLTPAILVVGLVGGHQGWKWQAERSLGRFVDDLRSKGEPVSLAEFIPAKVAERDNGAIDLRDAGESIRYEVEAWQAFVSLPRISLPLAEDEVEVIRAALDANTEGLARVAAAMGKPALDWTSVSPSPSASASARGEGRGPSWGFGMRGLGLFRQRGISQLLFAAVLVEHQEGNELKAFRHVDELLFLARATGSRPSLRAQLGSARLYEIAAEAVDQILPNLNVGDGPGQVPAKRVRELFTRLIDEGDARDAITRALRVERARHIDRLLGTAGGDAAAASGGGPRDGVAGGLPWADPLAMPAAGSTLERFVSRPVYLDRAQTALERLNLAIASFDAQDLREFITAFPERGMLVDDGHGDTELIDVDGENAHTRMLTSAIHQIGRSYYVGLARRRTTGLALAVVLYHAEHGRWPAADLAALVPEYLPKIPGDPLSTSGDPLNYLPAEDRPRVYSVGEDGIDDGGWSADAYNARPEDLRLTDWVVDLVRQARTPMTSMMAPRY